MPRGGKQVKHGLRVAYHDHVERLSIGKGEVLAAVPAGWFIEVFRGSKWVAIMDLRFVRFKDALRGMQSLTAAGLDTYLQLSRADPLTVREIACRFLQW